MVNQIGMRLRSVAALAFAVATAGTASASVFTPGVTSQGVDLVLLVNPDRAAVVDSIVTAGGIDAAGLTSVLSITSDILEAPSSLDFIVDVRENISGITLAGLRLDIDSNDSLNLFDQTFNGIVGFDFNVTTLRGFVLEADGETLTEVSGPGSGTTVVNRIVGRALSLSGTSIASLGDFEVSVFAEQRGGFLGAAVIGNDLVATSVVVPEPASLALLGLGSCLMLARRR